MTEDVFDKSDIAESAKLYLERPLPPYPHAREWVRGVGAIGVGQGLHGRGLVLEPLFRVRELLIFIVCGL